MTSITTPALASVNKASVVTDATQKDQLLANSTKIIELSTVAECDDYFRELNRKTERGVFGLDVEYLEGKYRGDQRPALIQIAGEHETVIIREPNGSLTPPSSSTFSLSSSSSSSSTSSLSSTSLFVGKGGVGVEQEVQTDVPLGSPLVEFLTNKNFIKTGVAVVDDAKFIEEAGARMGVNFRVESCIDLRFLLNKTNLKRTKLRNLGYLSKYFLGITLSKSPANWASKEKLTASQMSYAAADAFFGLQLFYRFWNSSVHCLDNHYRRHAVCCASFYPPEDGGATILETVPVLAPSYEVHHRLRLKKLKVDSGTPAQEDGKYFSKSEKFGVDDGKDDGKDEGKGEGKSEKKNVGEDESKRKGETMTNKVATGSTNFYSADNWTKIVEWIGDDTNKAIPVDSFKANQLAKENRAKGKKEKHPRLKQLTGEILKFPTKLDALSSQEFERLETLAQMNLLSRPAVSFPMTLEVQMALGEKTFRQLVGEVVKFCIAWRWNVDESVLSKMLDDLKKNAPAIDRQRKIAEEYFSKAERAVKEGRKRKYDEMKAKII